MQYLEKKITAVKIKAIKVVTTSSITFVLLTDIFEFCLEKMTLYLEGNLY